MSTCSNGTVIPTNNLPLACEEYTSSDCTVFINAITYLGLPPNSSLTEVFNAMLLSLIDARNRIITLEA
jgi:hypothetical protein